MASAQSDGDSRVTGIGTGREDVCLERKTDGQINLMHGKNSTTASLQQVAPEIKIHDLPSFMYNFQDLQQRGFIFSRSKAFREK